MGKKQKQKKDPTVYVERPGPIDDQGRADLLAGVMQTVSTSKLYQSSTVIQGLVAELVTYGAALKPSTDMVAADRVKLTNDEAAVATNRTNFDKTVNALLSAVEKDAKDEADAKGIGTTPRGPKPPKVPVAPPVVDVIIGKKARGYATVSAHETGKTKSHYAAQWSPEPIGPTTWATLIGFGKSRHLTGASGTKVWVRFAMVRGSIQSDWSTPVLVTIP